MPEIRLLLVDDHALFRDSLHSMFEREPDMVVLGTAATADAAIAAVAGLQPDIVLMDLSLPGKSGIEAIRDIHSRWPAVRVIALTMHSDEATVSASIRAGALGYVLKDASMAELLQAVRTVAAGGAALDPTSAARLLDHYRQLSEKAGESTGHGLTERELEVLRLLAAGHSTAAIAQALSLSWQTIKNLLSVVYQKLSVNNRTEAVAVALQRGLIPRDRSE